LEYLVASGGLVGFAARVLAAFGLRQGISFTCRLELALKFPVFIQACLEPWLRARVKAGRLR
jgi:hypothetical protein